MQGGRFRISGICFADTDNVVLQQQTLDRVKTDLDGFCICGENDAALFNENSLMDPVIIVFKEECADAEIVGEYS